MDNLFIQTGISVCIIAKNEAEMLKGCFESVKVFADEIIFVDTGSNDNSKAIANEFGCKLFDYAWNNDFAAARNFSMSKAGYSHIFIIDADERVSNPAEVRKILNSPSNVAGWLVHLVSTAKRKDGSFDTYINNLLRIFVNRPDIRFVGIIHEQVINSILKLSLNIEESNINIEHLGYGLSPEQMQQKQLRNLELLNKQIQANPNDDYAIFQRAKTYLALENLEPAEQDITKALEITSDNNVLKPQALNYGGIIAYQMNDYDKAISRAEESLKINKNQFFANFILGEVYSAKQNFPDAYEAYKRMEQSEKTVDTMSMIIGDYRLPPEQIAFRVGRSLVGLKIFDEAKKKFLQGLQSNPNDISCLVGLGNVAFHDKNFNEALNLLQKADQLQPNRNDIFNFISQVQKQISQQTESANQQSIYSSGQTTKPLITLSMIVKDEEETLAGCLDSVAGIAEEIVIVDTGSSDNTKSIAQKYGALIFDFPWINDFAAARNESMKHCTGEWILYLDADERLAPLDPNLLKNALRNASIDIGGYLCTIESAHYQLDGSTELHRGGYPRLFRNLGFPKIKFQGRVHEQITPSLFALNKSVDFSDIVITHLGYNQSREVMEGKVKRNYKMLMEHINEEPLNAYAWYQLGQTLAQMYLFDQAEDAIRFALNLKTLSGSVYASATATLAQLVGNKKKFDESLYWAERSLEKAPNQIYALNLKAYSLLYLQKPKEAEQLFLEILIRLRSKQGVPLSGFDVMVPEEIIKKGLQQAREWIK